MDRTNVSSAAEYIATALFTNVLTAATSLHSTLRTTPEAMSCVAFDGLEVWLPLADDKRQLPLK